MTQAKDYSLDGKDRAEWDQLWSVRTQRILSEKCRLNLASDFALNQLRSVTISEDPIEFSDDVWRESENCPICGNSTSGCDRLPATLNLAIQVRPENRETKLAVGVWAHKLCFENCFDTGEPAGIPW